MTPSYPSDSGSKKKKRSIILFFVLLAIIGLIVGSQIQPLVQRQIDRSISTVLVNGPLPGIYEVNGTKPSTIAIPGTITLQKGTPRLK
jgi:hypothetical protein